MPFNSYAFIFGLLPLAVAGFWLLSTLSGRVAGLLWLLAASLAFYAYAGLVSLAIITPSILLDYSIALALLRSIPSRERLRSLVFSMGIVANVLLLGYFKYRNFFLDTVNTVLGTHLELTSLLLPLGLSFLTFQKIAFLADVRSGQIKVVRFLDFLVFTLFFPRTVAGPIVHYQEIVPQLEHTTRRKMMTDLAVGISLFSLGLFKKAIVADNLAPFVSPAFDPPVGSTQSVGPVALLTAWSGVLAYTFQLYFDFSGYSDMASGIARMLGVRLPMNFNSPLKSRSIVEFWGRWHITLTRFLTAYIYTPLMLSMTRARITKNRPVLRGKHTALSTIVVLVGAPTFVTMTVSGLWHGAGWQFVVWGLLHAIYLTVNQTWCLLRPRFWSDQSSYDRVMRPLGFALTFGAVVIALTFFRASSVTSAVTILAGMIGINGILPHDAQTLQSLGASLNWTLIRALWQPIGPFLWIIVLFLVVTLLPNSLELLRRFHPALDFEEQAEGYNEPPVRPGQRGAKGKFAAARFRTAWAKLSTGVSLDPLTATAAALLFVLGVSAMNGGGAFLYWKF